MPTEPSEAFSDPAVTRSGTWRWLVTPWVRQEEDWVIVKRPAKLAVKDVIRRSESVGTAVKKGLSKVAVAGSSVLSKTPTKGVGTTTEQGEQASSPTVENVASTVNEVALVEDGRSSRSRSYESLSEDFHTDTEIVEAEPVHPSVIDEA